MPAPEVLLACARPAQVPQRDWDELASLLDAQERDRARRLRIDADRKAYVLAHALLRALVAAESGLDAEAIHIAHDVRGRPFIERAPELHVSMSHHRDAVACAATRAAPVGVDIERIAGKPVDAGLLGAFVVTHEAVTERQFFFQWTALEAFWKACGTGLSDAQPRICCVPRSGSRFDVHLERSRFDELRTGSGRCAGRGAIVNAFPDCALAVVLRAPVDPGFVLKRTHCSNAAELRQLHEERKAYLV
jgi:4'-phosphopantetheinyl transferase